MPHTRRAVGVVACVCAAAVAAEQMCERSITAADWRDELQRDGGPQRYVRFKSYDTGKGKTIVEKRKLERRVYAGGVARRTFSWMGWNETYGAGMLTQGGQGGRPAPLASRLHRIPTQFLLNLHGI